MLEIKSLTQHYKGSKSIQYPDWEVSKGTHSAILGNSGSGKTTLLHIIGGLLKPSGGEVSIDQTNISNLSQTELDRYRGKNIGIVFQKPHLVSALSVIENLMLSQYLGKNRSDKRAALKVMSQLDISDLASRRIHEISQGQAQRVSIGRALLNNPKLLLADEPTASLDDENCRIVLELLREQAALYDSTLIIATHDARVKSEFQNALSL